MLECKHCQSHQNALVRSFSQDCLNKTGGCSATGKFFSVNDTEIGPVSCEKKLTCHLRFKARSVFSAADYFKRATYVMLLWISI